jgi:hypothetical protein
MTAAAPAARRYRSVCQHDLQVFAGGRERRYFELVGKP